MAKRAKTTDAKASRPINRFAIIGMGAVIGFAFGTLMWVVTGLKGDWRVWLYLAITTAMLGIGVAAAFGISTVRKRGERVSPRFRRR